MIDLDDFKLVNDTLGHLFGDEVLRWAADQIRAALRGSDVPARYGGDEFVVLLPDTPGGGAREVGERIVAALHDHPYRGEGRGPVAVGASIGLASFPADGHTAQALIAGADAALYRVKRDGGRGVQGRVNRRPGPHAAQPAVRAPSDAPPPAPPPAALPSLPVAAARPSPGRRRSRGA